MSQLLLLQQHEFAELDAVTRLRAFGYLQTVERIRFRSLYRESTKLVTLLKRLSGPFVQDFPLLTVIGTFDPPVRGIASRSVIATTKLVRSECRWTLLELDLYPGLLYGRVEPL